MADLAQVLEYISTDNAPAARKLAQVIRTRTEALRDTPYLGRVSPTGQRELVLHRHYLVTYRLRAGRIEILQLWHTARRR